ncbi:MAG: RluA family pseudouridine synthase [Chloroflexota bacterium]
MDILLIDGALLVVNKPAGLPVLPDGWQEGSEYLVKILEAQHGRIWIVHRLDKVTSGALVLARTAEAHRSLSIQFEKHQAQKVYHAIANGIPDWDERTARQPLRSNVGHKHRTAIDPRHGKASSTTFRVLERFRAHVFLEARPLTGRTHQVRVHTAALRCPLLGDSLYGAPATEIIARPALHAFTLSFTHPESKEPTTCTAPYPEDFGRALEHLRARRY